MTAPDFTIADVLAFARTKPANETYDYRSIDNCALAQFARYAGLPLCGDDRVRLELGKIGSAAQAEYTFGALVTRLEALCPETTPSEWTRLDAYLADIEQVSAQ